MAELYSAYIDWDALHGGVNGMYLFTLSASVKQDGSKRT